MQRHKRVASVFLFSLAISAAGSAVAHGQTFVLAAPSRGTNIGELELNIAESGKGGASTIPGFATVGDKSLWHVTVYQRADGHLKLADPIEVTSVEQSANYSRTGQVTLVTNASYSLDTYTNHSIVVEIVFLQGEEVSTAWMVSKPPKGAGGGTETAGDESGSGQKTSSTGKSTGCGVATPGQPGASYFSYCLSGIWVPQEGSHPLYSTNSNFAWATRLRPGSLGLRGQEAADSSTVLDPNAFSSALFYQAVLANSSPVPHVMGVYFNWNAIGSEFDRKKKNTNLGTNVNVVTAPEFVFPISLGRGVGAEFDTGIEAGDNLKNNIDPNGFGAIFRGMLGAQAEWIYTPREENKTLKQIKVTSQYQVRLLAFNEVTTRSVHGVLVAHEGHQARNWVSSEIDFMFTKNFGLTLKHDYGSLPPGYVFTENRGTVGFTVQSSPH
jgi:hypothetical protein